MATLASVSASKARKAACSLRAVVASTALRRWGRERVIRVMPGDGDEVQTALGSGSGSGDMVGETVFSSIV